MANEQIEKLAEITQPTVPSSSLSPVPPSSSPSCEPAPAAIAASSSASGSSISSSPSPSSPSQQPASEPAAIPAEVPPASLVSKSDDQPKLENKEDRKEEKKEEKHEVKEEVKGEVKARGMSLEAYLASVSAAKAEEAKETKKAKPALAQLSQPSHSDICLKSIQAWILGQKQQEEIFRLCKTIMDQFPGVLVFFKPNTVQGQKNLVIMIEENGHHIEGASFRDALVKLLSDISVDGENELLLINDEKQTSERSAVYGVEVPILSASIVANLKQVHLYLKQIYPPLSIPGGVFGKTQIIPIEKLESDLRHQLNDPDLMLTRVAEGALVLTIVNLKTTKALSSSLKKLLEKGIKTTLDFHQFYIPLSLLKKFLKALPDLREPNLSAVYDLVHTPEDKRQPVLVEEKSVSRLQKIKNKWAQRLVVLPVVEVVPFVRGIPSDQIVQTGYVHIRVTEKADAKYIAHVTRAINVSDLKAVSSAPAPSASGAPSAPSVPSAPSAPSVQTILQAQELDFFIPLSKLEEAEKLLDEAYPMSNFLLQKTEEKLREWTGDRELSIQRFWISKKCSFSITAKAETKARLKHILEKEGQSRNIPLNICRADELLTVRSVVEAFLNTRKQKLESTYFLMQTDQLEERVGEKLLCEINLQDEWSMRLVLPNSMWPFLCAKLAEESLMNLPVCESKRLENCVEVDFVGKHVIDAVNEIFENFYIKDPILQQYFTGIKDAVNQSTGLARDAISLHRVMDEKGHKYKLKITPDLATYLVIVLFPYGVRYVDGQWDSVLIPASQMRGLASYIDAAYKVKTVRDLTITQWQQELRVEVDPGITLSPAFDRENREGVAIRVSENKRDFLNALAPHLMSEGFDADLANGKVIIPFGMNLRWFDILVCAKFGKDAEVVCARLEITDAQEIALFKHLHYGAPLPASFDKKRFSRVVQGLLNNECYRKFFRLKYSEKFIDELEQSADEEYFTQIRKILDFITQSSAFKSLAKDVIEKEQRQAEEAQRESIWLLTAQYQGDAAGKEKDVKKVKDPVELSADEMVSYYAQIARQSDSSSSSVLAVPSAPALAPAPAPVSGSSSSSSSSSTSRSSLSISVAGYLEIEVPSSSSSSSSSKKGTSVVRSVSPESEEDIDALLNRYLGPEQRQNPQSASQSPTSPDDAVDHMAILQARVAAEAADNNKAGGGRGKEKAPGSLGVAASLQKLMTRVSGRTSGGAGSQPTGRNASGGGSGVSPSSGDGAFKELDSPPIR